MRFRELITGLAALAAVAAAIFAMGGVIRWGQAVVAILIALSLAVQLPSRRGFARVSPLIALILAATTLTALQLVPLPRAVLQLLSPDSTVLRDDGAALMDVDASRTLTSDVPATLNALIFFLTLLAIAIVALRMAATERGRYRLVAGVAALCGVTSGVVWIHRFFNIESVYGLYEPRFSHPSVLGPILNANSLACLMAVGATLSIGLAAQGRQKGWVRLMWLLVVGSCGSVTVATISRGATIALAAGSLVTIGALIAQRLFNSEAGRRRRGRFATSALPIGVVAACMVVLVIFMNARNVERQLSNLSFDEVSYSRSKFAAWQSSRFLIEESPWLGVGRGAFETAFTRVHPPSGLAIYSHLENEYLQAVVDWGIPGAIILAAIAVWLVVTALRRWNDGPTAAGALGALAVVAIQANVDFGLEFLGVAAPITAVVASLAYTPLRELRDLRVPRAMRGTHVAALAIGATLLLSSWTTPLDEDREALVENPRLTQIQASVRRHPLDYYSYAVAAEIYSRRPDKESRTRAIRMLNHAMLLHPTHPGLHRLAAQLLLRDGFKEQAAIEYGVALLSAPDPKTLVVEILEKLPPEHVSNALPLDFANPEALVHILADLKHPEVARAWLSRVLQLRPKVSRACELLFWLAQEGDIDSAELASRYCAERLPDYQARLTLAQLLVRQGKHEAAIPLLRDVETWQSRREDKIDAWFLYCDSLNALAYFDEAKRCLRRLDASPDMLSERRGEIMKRIDAINHPQGSAVAP